MYSSSFLTCSSLYVLNICTLLFHCTLHYTRVCNCVMFIFKTLMLYSSQKVCIFSCILKCFVSVSCINDTRRFSLINILRTIPMLSDLEPASSRKVQKWCQCKTWISTAIKIKWQLYSTCMCNPDGMGHGVTGVTLQMFLHLQTFWNVQVWVWRTKSNRTDMSIFLLQHRKYF